MEHIKLTIEEAVIFLEEAQEYVIENTDLPAWVVESMSDAELIRTIEDCYIGGYNQFVNDYVFQTN